MRWVGGELLIAYTRAGKSADAMALVKVQLASARESLPATSPQLAAVLAQSGSALLELKAWADAEPILRECLAIREKKEPDDWRTFSTRSMLGGALLGQEKYSDAEPLLVHGYEGMKQRVAKIPANSKVRLTEALERLVRLYEATGETDKVAEWKKKLTEFDKAAVVE